MPILSIGAEKDSKAIHAHPNGSLPISNYTGATTWTLPSTSTTVIAAGAYEQDFELVEAQLSIAEAVSGFQLEITYVLNSVTVVIATVGWLGENEVDDYDLDTVNIPLGLRIPAGAAVKSRAASQANDYVNYRINFTVRE